MCTEEGFGFLQNGKGAESEERSLKTCLSSWKGFLVVRNSWHSKEEEENYGEERGSREEVRHHKYEKEKRMEAAMDGSFLLPLPSTFSSLLPSYDPGSSLEGGKKIPVPCLLPLPIALPVLLSLPLFFSRLHPPPPRHSRVPPLPPGEPPSLLQINGEAKKEKGA